MLYINNIRNDCGTKACYNHSIMLFSHKLKKMIYDFKKYGHSYKRYKNLYMDTEH